MAKKKSAAEKKAAGARRREKRRERTRERNAARREAAGPSASGIDPMGFWGARATAEDLTPALIDELVALGGGWTRKSLEEAAAEGFRYIRSRNTLTGPLEFEGGLFGDVDDADDEEDEAMDDDQPGAVRVAISFVDGSYDEWSEGPELLDRLGALQAQGFAGKTLIDQLLTDDWGAPPARVVLTGTDAAGQPFEHTLGYQ